jgi:hypothetical protein
MAGKPIPPNDTAHQTNNKSNQADPEHFTISPPNNPDLKLSKPPPFTQSILNKIA